jgi:hypothetical protein
MIDPSTDIESFSGNPVAATVWSERWCLGMIIHGLFSDITSQRQQAATRTVDCCHHVIGKTNAWPAEQARLNNITAPRRAPLPFGTVA